MRLILISFFRAHLFLPTFVFIRTFIELNVIVVSNIFLVYIIVLIPILRVIIQRTWSVTSFCHVIGLLRISKCWLLQIRGMCWWRSKLHPRISFMQFFYRLRIRLLPTQWFFCHIYASIILVWMNLRKLICLGASNMTRFICDC